MSDTNFFDVKDPYLNQSFGGEFNVEKQIGMGGMGTVYRAIQAMTERPVAIKVLHRHLAGEVLIKRFQLEAQIISKLNHPNIVTIFKYGQHTDGSLYIVMEYVEGRTLTDLILAKVLFDPRRFVPLMLQLTDAVAYAHDLKIIHRDLKPENIIVSRTGREERSKVLDFGIAKIVDTKYLVTKTGMLCGSPPFMSPEQWQQSRDLDGRTDIYSLGVVFYAMVTGRLPYEADSTPGYMSAHLAGNPTPPKERSDALRRIPALNDIILRCLQVQRCDRYEDAYALLEALKEVHLGLQTATAGDKPLESGTDAGEETSAVPAHPDARPGSSDTARGNEAGVTVGYGEKLRAVQPLSARTAEAAGRDDVRGVGKATTLADETPPDAVAGSESANGLENNAVSSLEFTRQTLMSPEERARALKIHLLFTIAGCLMLVFLACAFVYFVWIDKPPDSQTVSPLESRARATSSAIREESPPPSMRAPEKRMRAKPRRRRKR
ncbi:MAG: serine/threonine-protein kinase [bacterium]